MEVLNAIAQRTTIQQQPLDLETNSFLRFPMLEFRSLGKEARERCRPPHLNAASS